jgi:hypothetical protein
MSDKVQGLENDVKKLTASLEATHIKLAAAMELGQALIVNNDIILGEISDFEEYVDFSIWKNERDARKAVEF